MSVSSAVSSSGRSSPVREEIPFADSNRRVRRPVRQAERLLPGAPSCRRSAHHAAASPLRRSSSQPSALRVGRPGGKPCLARLMPSRRPYDREHAQCSSRSASPQFSPITTREQPGAGSRCSSSGGSLVLGSIVSSFGVPVPSQHSRACACLADVERNELAALTQAVDSAVDVCPESATLATRLRRELELETAALRRRCSIQSRESQDDDDEANGASFFARVTELRGCARQAAALLQDVIDSSRIDLSLGSPRTLTLSPSGITEMFSEICAAPSPEPATDLSRILDMCEGDDCSSGCGDSKADFGAARNRNGTPRRDMNSTNSGPVARSNGSSPMIATALSSLAVDMQHAISRIRLSRSPSQSFICNDAGDALETSRTTARDLGGEAAASAIRVDLSCDLKSPSAGDDSLGGTGDSMVCMSGSEVTALCFDFGTFGTLPSTTAGSGESTSDCTAARSRCGTPSRDSNARTGGAVDCSSGSSPTLATTLSSLAVDMRQAISDIRLSRSHSQSFAGDAFEFSKRRIRDLSVTASAIQA